MKKSEGFRLLLDYFLEIGRVPSKREYIALGNNAPIPHKAMKRFFGLSADYFSILKHIKTTYPTEWNRLEPSPVPKAAPVMEPPKEPVEAPEVELSPLEKLRVMKGESIE